MLPKSAQRDSTRWTKTLMSTNCLVRFHKISRLSRIWKDGPIDTQLLLTSGTPGRCSHFLPATLKEEEKEEYMAKMQEVDAGAERFRDLTQDVPVTGLEISWLVRVNGDTQ